jgi:hypothetical protein
MEWMNEMGEMIAVDAPEREDAFDAMVDTGIAIIAQRSCEDKTCWIGDNHTNDCLPF